MDNAEFASEMNAVNWNDILPQNNDVNDIFDSFINKVTAIVDKFAPLKRLSNKQIKNFAKPWVTVGIRKPIQIKNRLYKQYIRSRNPCMFVRYKLYRNLTNSLLRLSKKMYYSEYFKIHTANMKNIWKGINELIMLKTRCLNLPNKLIKVNSLFSQPGEL